MNKKRLLISVQLGLFVGSLIHVTSSAYSQVLVQIRELDNSAMLLPSESLQKSNRGFSVSFAEVRQAIPGYREGVRLSSGQAAWTADWCVLKIISDLEGGPVYRPPQTDYKQDPEYDSLGKLMIAHTAEQYFICTKDRNERLDIMMRYAVDPKGAITTNKMPVLELNRFPPGDRNSVYLFKQLIQATGRGFAQDLAVLTSEKSLDRLVQIEAKGSSGPWLPGHWVLTCEKGPDPLIRMAAFFTDAAPDRPDLEISNSGTVGCHGLTLARMGDLRIGPLKTSFEILGLLPLESSDPHQCALYREVQKRLDEPLPSGSHVIDRSGEKLKITRTE